MDTAWKAAALAASVIIGTVTVAHAGNEYFPRFTALQDSEDASQYYNAGFGADDPTDCPSLPAGSSYCYGPASGGPGNSGPGPNWQISFTPGAQVIYDTPTAYDNTNGLPASGTFSNAPGGNTALVFVNAPSAIMDVANGFTTGFAFAYAADDGGSSAVFPDPTDIGTPAGSVTVWSGLDATGTLLATIVLDYTSDCFCYDIWDTAGVAFGGTAYSIGFNGAENNVLFQVVSVGVTTPNFTITTDTEVLPEPASLALLGAAITGLGLVRRRRTN